MKKSAVLLKIDKPDEDAGHAPAELIFENGEVAHTWVRTWSDVIDHAQARGLDPDKDVKAAIQTVHWLKNNEGWPEGKRIRRL